MSSENQVNQAVPKFIIPAKRDFVVRKIDPTSDTGKIVETTTKAHIYQYDPNGVALFLNWAKDPNAGWLPRIVRSFHHVEDVEELEPVNLTH